MIDRIIIENFKSLRKVDLSLGSLNLFIGTNASGKSNFLDALRTLQGIGNGSPSARFLTASPGVLPLSFGKASGEVAPMPATSGQM